MGKINTGGPAFPFIQWRSPDGMIGTDLSAGMTLRDWFAGQALPQVMNSVSGLDMPTGTTSKMLSEVIAVQAYELADAMLAERSKGGSDA